VRQSHGGGPVRRQPGDRHLEHRPVRIPPGADCVTVKDGRVLLLWRHRFITDTCGWGIPVGKIDPGEDPAHAAARETELASATSTPRWSRAAGAEDIGEIHRTSRAPAPLRPWPRLVNIIEFASLARDLPRLIPKSF
jgi:hypothetical protein